VACAACGARSSARQTAGCWLCHWFGLRFLEGAFNLDATENWFLGGWCGWPHCCCMGWPPVSRLRLRALSADTTARPVVAGLRAAVIMHGLWNACALTMAFVGIAMGLSAFTLNVLLVCVSVCWSFSAILMVLLIRRVARAGVQSSIQKTINRRVCCCRQLVAMKFNFGWRFVAASQWKARPRLCRLLNQPPKTQTPMI